MPKLLEWNGWRFFFYAREGMPLEPPHVHVRKDRSEAKIWLSPVSIASDGGWTLAHSRCYCPWLKNIATNSRSAGMSFFPEPVSASFDEFTMSVALDDGRTISVPLAWYSRLLGASREQLEAYELSPSGIHWDELDEDISVEGMMAARVTFSPTRRAA